MSNKYKKPIIIPVILVSIIFGILNMNVGIKSNNISFNNVTFSIIFVVVLYGYSMYMGYKNNLKFIKWISIYYLIPIIFIIIIFVFRTQIDNSMKLSDILLPFSFIITIIYNSSLIGFYKYFEHINHTEYLLIILISNYNRVKIKKVSIMDTFFIK